MVNDSLYFKKAVVLNRYYKITKFYSFLKNTALKAGITILLFLGLFILLEYFFIDSNELLNKLVANYSGQVIFGVFLISETFLGLIPPEIFIAWSAKSVSPWFYLFVLASMSYLGGIISYFIGKQLFRIPSIKYHIAHKIAIHISNLRKWGGVFVFIGAMLPIPHSVVSLACGLINYNFKNYVFWALFRYVRFALYALVIFKVF
jgi:membrane protein YqaA with SNARE-associated domain